MSAVYQPMALELHLPWEVDELRERAFKRHLKRLLIPLCLLALIIPWLPSIPVEDALSVDPPSRTQVLLDPIEAPEPEPVAPEPEPEPVRPEPAQPEPEPVAPQSTPSQQTAEPAPTPADRRESVAQSQGMDELSNQLNALRGSVNVASLRRKNLTAEAAGEVARAERSRLGREMTRRSDGVVVDDAVMASDVTALAAHDSADVEGLAMSDLPAGGPASHRSGGQGHRDMESIRRTLERTKGNVYALYQRALQENPGLTGEFTFKLVIEPEGHISQLTLLVSELGARDLEQEILHRIEQVNFGAMSVPPTVVEYRFVFMPS